MLLLAAANRFRDRSPHLLDIRVTVLSEPVPDIAHFLRQSWMIQEYRLSTGIADTALPG
jgi:hypothetical protein